MLIDRFGLSKERIGAAFAKGSSHPSLSAYINDLRLEHAYMLMLDQPGLDLGQVAQQSGFSSRKYFGDRFKSRYGMTPSEFRAARQ
jgi:AraC-like DNA-binding protein